MADRFMKGATGGTIWQNISAGHAAQFAIDTTAGGEGTAYQHFGLLVGASEKPGFEINQNFTPIEAIGSYKDLEFSPGRIESSLRGRFFPADVSALDSVYKRDASSGNLGLFSAQITTPAITQTATKCRFRTFSMEFREGQPVIGTIEVWPTTFAEDISASGAQTYDINQNIGNVFRFYNLQSVAIGSGSGAEEDIRNAIESITVGITNELQRVGMATTRYPVAIVPLMEKLQVSMTLHLPLAMQAESFQNLSPLVLTLAQTEAMPHHGLNTMVITIEEAHLTTSGSNEAGANAILTYTATLASKGITISHSGGGSS